MTENFENSSSPPMTSLAAKAQTFFQQHVIFFSVLPAILGTLTIGLLYIYSVLIFDHIPSYIQIPFISLMGCRNPEHTIYQIGFTLTALSVIFFYNTFNHSILYLIPTNNNVNTNTSNSYINVNRSQHIHDYSTSKRILKFTVLLCAFGVLMQGIITMDETILNFLSNFEENGTSLANYQPSFQTSLHQMFAALFFIGALVHGITSVRLYWQLSSIVKEFEYINFSKYLKLIILATPTITTFFAFRFHPANTQGSQYSMELQEQARQLNMSGFSQWLTVASYLIFFASYSIDYYYIQQFKKSNNT